MLGALTTISTRQWSMHKLRIALTIMGVALGVAVFFAIQSTNTTIVDSLHSTIEKLAGKATIQITSGSDSGFPVEYLSKVKAMGGVALAEPATETVVSTQLADNEKLLLLGLDTGSDLKIYSEMFDDRGFSAKNPIAFTSRTDSIALSRKFAERTGLKDGDKLTVQTQLGLRDLTVRALFKSIGAGEVYDGNVAVMDLYSAQEMFSRTGRIDRIDIMNTPGTDVDELITRIASEFPAGIKVSRPDLRGKSLENSVSTMHFGLTVMSFLAFIICGFLIYNSFAISVNQRWKEIGIMRSLGVPRGAVQQMFIIESIVIGMIGSLIGIVGGFVLAKVAIGIVLRVSMTMYGFVASPKALEFDVVFAAEAFAVGIMASVIAAWLPARAAARLDPVNALYNIDARNSAESVMGAPRLIVGILCVIAGLGLTVFSTPAVGRNIQLFFALLVQLGMILLLPKIIAVGAAIIRPFMNFTFGVEGLIAAETMARAPRRTASTVGALMVGLAFVFSTAAFVVSQKAALNSSLDKALDADIMIASSEQLQSSPYHFSPEVAGRITAVPGIEHVDAIRVASTNYNGETVSLLGHDMDAYFAISPDLLDVGNAAEARSATAAGTGVLVSNNFALRWGNSIGDKIKLEAPGGSVELPIVGMLNYYRSEVGTVFIDRKVYQKYWNDPDVDYFFIDLAAGTETRDFKERVSRVLAGQQNAFVYTHDEYKAWVNRLVDQFFILMYLQMVVAIFVAALGLVNTMVISVDERRREIGIFRAVGGLRRQVIKMVLLEASAISLIGLAAAAIFGAFNAYFLVSTAAKVVAGFSVKLVFPYPLVISALPFVIAVALAAAAFPALRAARSSVVEAIGYE